MAEAAMEKLRGLVLKGTTGALRSTLTTTVGFFLGVGAMKNILSVQAAKAHYRIQYSHVRMGD